MHDSDTLTWAVAGTYFEACSCLPICPCRQIGGRDDIAALLAGRGRGSAGVERD